MGWLGTVGTFSAYLLLSRGLLDSTSIWYAVMNMIGGALGGLACAAYGTWPAATSNFVWAAIGAQSTATALRAMSAARATSPARVDTPTMTLGTAGPGQFGAG